MAGSRAHTKRGRSLVAVGVALVAAALAAFAVDAHRAAEVRDQSDRLCPQLVGRLDQLVPAGADTGLDATALPVLQLSGVDVVARLQAPSPGLDLPVAAEGSDAALTPVRVPRPDGDEGKLEVEGSAYQANGAWGQLCALPAGERVSLTSMAGARQEYVVVSTGRTSAEFDDNFDLLVYYVDGLGTKTWAGCTKSS